MTAPKLFNKGLSHKCTDHPFENLPCTFAQILNKSPRSLGSSGLDPSSVTLSHSGFMYYTAIALYTPEMPCRHTSEIPHIEEDHGIYPIPSYLSKGIALRVVTYTRNNRR